jgi:hypothetical protein
MCSAQQQDSTGSTCIKINVGGVDFTTTLGTLRAVPGSYLDTLFSNRWTPSMLVPSTTTPFIDRSPECFHHVLAYLRCLQYTNYQPTLPQSASQLQQLRNEAEFYLLPGLAELCDLGPRIAGWCSSGYHQETASAGGFKAVGLFATNEANLDESAVEQLHAEGTSMLSASLATAVHSAAVQNDVAADVATEGIHITIQHCQQQQQQQQQRKTSLSSLQPTQGNQPYLARCITAAKRCQAAQQAAWSSNVQLQQLAEQVLEHLLDRPLAAEQPDLVALLATPERAGCCLELLLRYRPVGEGLHDCPVSVSGLTLQCPATLHQTTHHQRHLCVLMFGSSHASSFLQSGPVVCQAVFHKEQLVQELQWVLQ